MGAGAPALLRRAQLAPFAPGALASGHAPRADAGRAVDYLLVDFLRAELGQDFGAHLSPLAADHAGSDRFLVLDVKRIRSPPYWARAADLFRAMNTNDPDAGASRGWLVVTPRPGAPGRVPIPTVTHRIFRLVAAAALSVFLLGALAGGLLMRWRIRRTLIPRAR